jgi:hypothetical protein
MPFKFKSSLSQAFRNATITRCPPSYILETFKEILDLLRRSYCSPMALSDIVLSAEATNLE